MKWASAISTERYLDRAVNEACDRIEAELAGLPPDLVLLFASPHYTGAWADASGTIARRFPGARLIGCTGGGIIGAGRELEGTPAVSLTAAHLPGVTLRTFHLEGAEIGDTPDDDARLVERTGVSSTEEPTFVLLTDPFTFDSNALVRRLDALYPRAVKLGGLASGGRHAKDNVLFFNMSIHHSGAVGVSMTGNVTVDTVVAQGCRPIGQPMLVTRHDDNVILELGSKPALAVLRDLFNGMDARDRELAQSSLFVGVEMRDQREYHQGDFLVRNIIGVDAKRQGIAIGAVLTPWQVVQFHLRDATTSAEDLARLLDRTKSSLPGTPEGALLFSCLGRGEHLYGEAGHDSRLVQQRFGTIALGGFFCNGEIGPVGDRTFLHGYTSAIGLFRPKDEERSLEDTLREGAQPASTS